MLAKEYGDIVWSRYSQLKSGKSVASSVPWRVLNTRRVLFWVVERRREKKLSLISSGWLPSIFCFFAIKFMSSFSPLRLSVSIAGLFSCIFID